MRLASEIRKFIDETQTRAFSARFAKRMKNGAVPTMPQAGVYAVVMHYLKAAVALNGGLGDGVAVVNKMKDIPTDDLLFGQGKIRIDGRNRPSAHLFEVTTPAESKAPWDLYKLLAAVPGEKALRPLSEGRCSLVPK